MHEEFESIARLQSEVLADGLWNGRLPFATAAPGHVESVIIAGLI